jgi:signal transduction histidine kinase/AmiR/NasT family two-component response regulator
VVGVVLAASLAIGELVSRLAAPAPGEIARLEAVSFVLLLLAVCATGCAARWARGRLEAQVNQLEAWCRTLAQAGDNPSALLEQLHNPSGEEVRGLAEGMAELARRQAGQLAQRDGEIAMLATAREAAESANRLKSEFLATISHEIRTPLNGVLAMAEVMAADELDPTQRDRLAVVLKSGEAVIQLLNDVLDLARIEAGQLTLETAVFDPGRVAEEAVAAFRPLAASRGLLLQLIVSDAAHAPRVGDPARLRQVLNNLIANSLKFTAAGRIKVEMRVVDDALRLSVTDTGIGIAPADLHRVFEKYASGDPRSRNGTGGGTGLGLAISKTLCELMGGRIWADPDRPKGAAFHVRLPLPPATAGALPTPQDAPQDAICPQDHTAPIPALARTTERDGPQAGVPEAGTLDGGTPEAGTGEPETTPDTADRPLRVLAAEDNVTNRLVLEAMVSILGFDMDIVGDGAAAVEAWNTGDYDVILMDIQMPVLDGIDATRRIRAQERLSGRARTPIAAVSANAMSHQVAEYLAAGMDRHVAKPIELARLHSAIVEALTEPARVEFRDENTTRTQNGQP